MRGTVSPLPQDMTIRWVAAAPADRRTSFSGSGIPFASEQQAFERRQSGTACVAKNGGFSVTLSAPNSYHVSSSERPLPPRLFVFWEAECGSHKLAIPIDDAAVPGRSLRSPVGPYDISYPDVQSQETYLRSSAYPHT